MFVVANRIYVNTDWTTAFEERFQKRAGEIDKQTGFVRLEILRPDDEKSPYIVLTTWENKTAFEQWVGSDDFKKSHQNPLPKEAFSQAGQLEMHEVIIHASSTA